MNFEKLSNTTVASNELFLAREIFLTSYYIRNQLFPLEVPYDNYWKSHYDVRETNTLGDIANHCYPLCRTPENLKVILKSWFPEGSNDFNKNYNDLLKVPKDTLLVFFSAWKGGDNIPLAIFISKSRADPVRMCWYCGKEAKSTCSKCKIGKFCNRECQSKYWPIHKQVCDEIFEFIDITPLTVPMEKFIILND